MSRLIRRAVHRFVLPAARRMLPARFKRLLKRAWDPNQTLSPPEALLLRAARNERTRLKGDVPGAASYDIVCFPVFEWGFRFQRPQQLMRALAKRGHRVFYLAVGSGSRRRIGVEAVAPNVWQVDLPRARSLDQLAAAWSDSDVDALVDGLAELRSAHHIDCAVAAVLVPTWQRTAARASTRFGWLLWYDCMDEWASFGGVAAGQMADEERTLASSADLVTATSQRLATQLGHAVLVSNAADFETFAAPGNAALLEDVKHPVVGYYGAISEWFDVALLSEAARLRPQYTFVLIGAVSNNDVSPLERLPNVHLLGEKPYDLMPAYLASFDVCVIPFRLTPLTDATDPVKLYEYLSAGKPVVATPLPEVEKRRDLVYLASSGAQFAERLDEAVAEDASKRDLRIAYARANSWEVRAAAVEEAIASAAPLLSIVVVTFGNIDYTRTCLESVFRNTHDAAFEVLVVDNGSTDGTADYLRDLATHEARLRVVLNERNEGFAAANNRGIGEARGERIVLLNNDTVVPAGWSCRLIRHLQNESVGLAVAVTNFSGNESRIDVDYGDLDEMERFAAERAASHDGRLFDIRVAAMYCVAMRRDVLEKVGPLDERFAIGMFEDDDYSLRVRRAGFRVVCAEDAFVHHFGQASFKKLSQAEYFELFERNRALYEEKWGEPWVPHDSRSTP